MTLLGLLDLTKRLGRGVIVEMVWVDLASSQGFHGMNGLEIAAPMSRRHRSN